MPYAPPLRCGSSRRPTRLPFSPLLAAALLLLAPLAGAAQQPDTGLARGIAQADSIVADAVARERVPGAVLLVAQHGRVLHERAYGYAQLYELREGRVERLAEPRPLHTSTLFDLASVTKVMATTFAAMLLVDRGVLDLDAPVGRYLPELGDPPHAAITVRHLLTHSSGLYRWQPIYYHARNAAEVLAHIDRLPLESEVGASRQYSDLGFMLLGAIVERVDGRPLDVFVREELYAPLGLRTTVFNPREHGFTEFAATSHGNPYERQMVHDTAFGYRYGGDPAAWDGWRTYTLVGEVNDGNAYYAHGGVAGHAGLFSTAAELRVLLDLLLRRGEYGGRRYLRPETVDAFLTRDRYGHGLGWMMPRELPDGSFAHTGFTGTYVAGVPRHGLAVVLLTNRQNLGRDDGGQYPNVNGLRAAVLRALVAGAAADAAADASR